MDDHERHDIWDLTDMSRDHATAMLDSFEHFCITIYRHYRERISKESLQEADGSTSSWRMERCPHKNLASRVNDIQLGNIDVPVLHKTPVTKAGRKFRQLWLPA